VKPLPNPLAYLMALSLACAACTATAAEIDTQLLAQLLMKRAEASHRNAQLGMALLQHAQAERLHPATAQGSLLAAALADAAQAEAQLLEKGLAAARARELAAVQQAVRGLRLLDRQSSAALEVVLRYQAALADHGGAFPRARWADFSAATKKD
jgi:hypothetical protein